MSSLTIQPIPRFRATVRPPGSKSLTNRALLLAALADGPSVLHGPLVDADDTQRMMQALGLLGFTVRHNTATNDIEIVGLGGTIPNHGVKLNLGNAGTAYRFLTAACCLGSGGGRYELDGIDRMRQRPIGQLVEAIHEIGGEVDFLNTPGFPPLLVHGTGLRGGELTMPPTLSSQYISALLQIAPYCKDGLTLRFDGPVTSRPYVAMTLSVMAQFGVDAEVDQAFTRIRVAPGTYRGREYLIEPDASNASYFLAAAAIIPGSRCTIEGLGKGSVQGDVGFADVLQKMGAGMLFGKDFITIIGPPENESLKGIDIDLNDMPDMAQTLAVVALFAHGPTVIRNVGNLRVKETDRLAALQTELTRLGATVRIDGDDLAIQPPPGNRITPPSGGRGIDTYNDHRMAMSFAVAGLRVPGIVINDPGCVDKTFPAFFEYLARLAQPRF